MKTRNIVLMLMLCFVMVFAAACGSAGSTNNEVNQGGAAEPTPQENTNGEAAVEEPLSGELVVYSARNEKFVDALLQKFQDETGITVKALHAGDAVVNKIIEEGNNTQADVLISNDVGSMEHLRLQGLLQGSEPEGIESIDPLYRAEDNSWFGLSARSRVLIYNKDLITEEELPQTIWELTDEKWKDQFMITRGGNGSMVAHVSALRNEWGDEKTTEWLTKVKDNAGAITDGHGDIRKAVGAGEYKFGLVNNYYYHQQLNEPSDNNVGALYPDQGEDEMGVFVNAAGVALIKGAPNESNAQHFLEWILLPENQKEFSFASKEVPLNPEIQTTEEAKRISDYKTMSMPLNKLGEVWLDTKELIEKAGLDLEIK
ncbi:extracellular solute-binding protein [Paenibacillus abyssi]|uniref:Iron(III) ABC transporter iron (III)-binding protein n=1 Tax=Paenibacillus abyssi TaxID=1340531 RepID=A0A917FTP1_9BACL|nr:extracellular solute-binding protein [Paenibacillus abyssi]GGG00800.1 iron(III) ABC transporter iron (III)-binding protein [Paenibacillus abyssi]